MRNLCILLFCSLLLLSISCSKGKPLTDDFDDVELTDSILWNDSFIHVSNIVITDSIVWVSSNQDRNEILSAYSRDGKLIAQGIKFGSGPGELYELTSIHPYADNSITIYDGRRGRLYKISVTQGMFNVNTLADSIRLCDDVLLVDSGRILVLPLNSSNSYYLSDMQGHALDSLSYFPPKPTGVTPDTHHLACTGALTSPIGGNKFLRTTLYDGGLDFFKIEDDKISHVKRFSIFDMDYDVLYMPVEIPIPNGNSRVGYSCLFATDSYFYASYSDCKAIDNPDGGCFEIHQFDMDGNPLKKYNFNYPITSFAVERDDSFMYTVSEQDDIIHIVKYSLK